MRQKARREREEEEGREKEGGGVVVQWWRTGGAVMVWCGRNAAAPRWALQKQGEFSNQTNLSLTQQNPSAIALESKLETKNLGCGIAGHQTILATKSLKIRCHFSVQVYIMSRTLATKFH